MNAGVAGDVLAEIEGRAEGRKRTAVEVGVFASAIYPTEEVEADGARMAEALRAVLAVASPDNMLVSRGTHWIPGYRHAMEDILAAITAALGCEAGK